MGINYVAGTNVLGKRGFPFPVFHLVVVLFHNKIIHMARNSLLLSLEIPSKTGLCTWDSHISYFKYRTCLPLLVGGNPLAAFQWSWEIKVSKQLDYFFFVVVLIFCSQFKSLLSIPLHKMNINLLIFFHFLLADQKFLKYRYRTEVNKEK